MRAVCVERRPPVQHFKGIPGLGISPVVECLPTCGTPNIQYLAFGHYQDISGLLCTSNQSNNFNIG